MRKELTIALDAEVFDALEALIRSDRIGQFLNDLARPHVVAQDRAAAYAVMAADEQRELEALAWSEGLISDVADELHRVG